MPDATPTGFPLNYRKADEEPSVELFQLPQREYDAPAEIAHV